VGAIIVGLRPGDHKDLNQIAEQIGRPAKEIAGILLEQAIRHERGRGFTDTQPTTTAPREPEAVAR